MKSRPEQVKIAKEHDNYLASIKNLKLDEMPINDKIKSLNEIIKYQSALSDEKKFIDSISTVKSITNLDVEYTNCINNLQIKIEKDVEDIINRIIDDKDAVDKEIAAFNKIADRNKTKKVLLDGEETLDEFKKIKTDRVILNKLKTQLDTLNGEINSIVSSIQTLPAMPGISSSGDRLSAVKNTLEQVATKIKAIEENIEKDAVEMLSIQNKANENLTSIIAKIEVFQQRHKSLFEGLEKLKKDIDSFKIANATEKEIENQIKWAELIPKYEKTITEFQNEISKVEEELKSLDDAKYLSEKPVQFSDEYLKSVKAQKEAINLLNVSCDGQAFALGMYKDNANCNIEALNQKKASLIHDTKQFDKVDGSQLADIKSWILENENFNKLLKHLHKSSSEKQKDMMDFLLKINKTTNLDTLLALISTSYRKNLATIKLLNPDMQNILADPLHQKLRQSTSLLKFYQIKGYQSTTDKYLSLLEKDLFNHLNNTYKLDLKLDVKEQTTLKLPFNIRGTLK